MLKLVITLALVAAIRAQDPVRVTVYYESLCPDSIAFISTQLWPTYQLVPEIFTTTFVPYGFENYTADGEGYDFNCQHGPEECKGNKIHSCATYYYPDNTDNVPFISCSMSAPDPVAACEECAAQGNLDWTEINECASTDLGSQLLKANGDKTAALVPPVWWMPTVVINEVYSDENQNMATTDFLKLVCTSYTGTPPDECD